MATENLRTVSLTRKAHVSFEATNSRGQSISMGDGSTDEFTPVELLLAAVAGCSAIDVDFLTSRLSEPDAFVVRAAAEKVRDEHGNHLADVSAEFSVTFPAGEGGDAARNRLPDAVAKSRDRLCTVSRTVALPTPVVFTVS
ncbi:OsmC family protein [Ornithinimicrobium sp. INDO-MA30-4]|uniref:OsmC family protein n=1 Tax=Ornithinimicrobium sp. INDO-MA30-4 TaxID=2908651 RepID=UPI001F3612E5|nr:OsmC family protein [Ornithinimicrobium sp. INDO-MA30-4]UJH71115.1 OsmC family protein [Ornithinimicrobium sp. INDO-MA30-4]